MILETHSSFVGLYQSWQGFFADGELQDIIGGLTFCFLSERSTNENLMMKMLKSGLK